MKNKLFILILSLIIAILTSSCGYQYDVIKIIEKSDEEQELIPDVPDQNNGEIEKPTLEDPIPGNSENEEDQETTETDAVPPSMDISIEDPNTPILMSTPPTNYYRSDQTIEEQSNPIKLNLKSMKDNKITDIDDWLKNNHLTFKVFEPANFLIIETRKTTC